MLYPKLVIFPLFLQR